MTRRGVVPDAGEDHPADDGTEPCASPRTIGPLRLVGVLLVLAAVGVGALVVYGPQVIDSLRSRPGAETTSLEPVEPPTPVVPGGDLDYGFGVYRGSGASEEVDQYESWLGRPITHVVDFVGGADEEWSDPWRTIDDPSWWCNQWRDSDRTVIYSVAILPDDRLTLEQGAAGVYNGHWRQFGETMVKHGCGSAILRLGWEFNGRYYAWAAGGKEEVFAEYWREIVSALEAVDGTSFEFEWSPIAGNYNADVELAYPGDAYVDIIGLSSYDTSNADTDSPESRWAHRVNEKVGLRWHKKFAAERGKPISFPEWGLTVRPNDDLGGGDNPYYIERMFEWFWANDVVYMSYFEADAVDANHRLQGNQFPESQATFLRLAEETVSGRTGDAG
jgi:hypothetical protein